MKVLQILKKVSLLLFLSGLFVSCETWTDVKPQTQVEEEVFFSKESGYKDLLAGVYIKMGDPALYGRELTFGLSDVLAQYYDLSLEPSRENQTYQRAERATYADTEVRKMIDNIWGNGYNAITNLNLLLQRLESADRNIFQDGNYEIIKGEALGLRAYIHFDMLRLFGTSVRSGGDAAKAIPYVTVYKNQVTPRGTHAEVIAHILDDLKQARLLLAQDPIVTGRVISSDQDNGYLMSRALRFNYYAVRALEARVHLWAGHTAEALAAAQEIISVAETKFPWVQNAQLTGTENNIDRTFTSEYIFGLFQNKKIENIEGYITDQAYNFQPLAITTGTLNAIYPLAESGADIRRIYLTRTVFGQIYFAKMYQTAQTNPNFANRMPLIRIPEVYYIAAEALIGRDNAAAVGYLEKVRTARGVSRRLATDISDIQLETEIALEYRKEMPSEGQLFYYHKRLNKTSVPGYTGSYNTSYYVLPVPLNEIEYGR